MKQQTKLSQVEQNELAAELLTRTSAAQEFASAEELLRHDAAQITVPPGLEARLQKSASQIPPPPQSWWRRFFKS